MNNKLTHLIGILRNIDSEITDLEDEKLKKEIVIADLKKSTEETIDKLNLIFADKGKGMTQLLNLKEEVIKTYFEQINSTFNSYYSNSFEKYKLLFEVVQSLLNEIQRIDYLSLIQEKNVILVGGNGVGKSSFASYLKESMSSNIVVIPAQKFLFYDKMINSLHLTERDLVNNLQKENFIGRGRFHNSNDDYEVRSFMNELSELFSKLITVIVNEQVAEEHSIIKSNTEFVQPSEETILYRLNNLWRTLIPDIIFEMDTTKRTLIPIKNGQAYSLNAMSDGEKSILYYICQVFLAEENSFIVVDEPETFLNVSNFNRLWNALENHRKDCKFIYISHDIDFIVTRSNVDLLWCKNYIHPNHWEIKNLKSETGGFNNLPRELLSEILGIRKSILFCEGKKASLDYQVYTELFNEEVVVVPVEGHRQVIQYTKAYNDSPILNNNHAYGIIDSDLMTEEQINDYKESGIYTLPFNEIEMIFFTDEIMNCVLRGLFTEEEISEKITEFKNEIFKEMSQNKETVVQEKIKKYIDNNLSNYRINGLKSSDKIIDEVVAWLHDLNLLNFEIVFSEELDVIIQEENYNALLKVTPQKKSISKGLANKILDSNYETKAKNKLKLDKELSNEIRRKYFSHVVFENTL